MGLLVILAFGSGRVALDPIVARFSCKSWQPMTGT